jgi:hypothetical protein
MISRERVGIAVLTAARMFPGRTGYSRAVLRRRTLYDPRLITASPRHAAVYARYEHVYAWADAVAALAFVIGSFFFLVAELKHAGEWFFVIGSILFAVVPLAKHLQAVHMRRLPVPEEGSGAGG